MGVIQGLGFLGSKLLKGGLYRGFCRGIWLFSGGGAPNAPCARSNFHHSGWGGRGGAHFCLSIYRFDHSAWGGGGNNRNFV